MNREKINYNLNELAILLENLQEEVGAGVEEGEIFDSLTAALEEISQIYRMLGAEAKPAIISSPFDEGKYYFVNYYKIINNNLLVVGPKFDVTKELRKLVE